jgi:hypothetical protein
MKVTRHSSLYPSPFVAGAQDGFFGAAVLNLPCLVAQASPCGGDVEGLYCCMHRLTNGSWQARIQSLLTDVCHVLSHCIDWPGLRPPFWGCKTPESSDLLGC